MTRRSRSSTTSSASSSGGGGFEVGEDSTDMDSAVQDNVMHLCGRGGARATSGHKQSIPPPRSALATGYSAVSVDSLMGTACAAKGAGLRGPSGAPTGDGSIGGVGFSACGGGRLRVANNSIAPHNAIHTKYPRMRAKAPSGGGPWLVQMLSNPSNRATVRPPAMSRSRWGCFCRITYRR